MAKPELGTKRICPETGRKFYDLNKDPIVSPYTGMTYARSYFEGGSAVREEEEEVETKELDAEEGAEIVSLEDADEETKGGDLPDLDDDEDVDLGDDDDTFLADDEEEDDDVADIIGVGGEDDDEV
ncbi:TIGR02300 family protein [Aquibium microcysteis]|uniref:TIGR02300 family protein n=1 Tax=Aquibium microcysteis TaxID=675281 RepID=UPI00165D12C1|nr:TIGR02300 family protein [Aquibium microcysteis]